jgi:hypothetical protein
MSTFMFMILGSNNRQHKYTTNMRNFSHVKGNNEELKHTTNSIPRVELEERNTPNIVKQHV